jgi:urea transport system permease protein
VRSIFTALNRSVETPNWMSGTLQVNDALSITYNRLYIVIFTMIVFAALLVVLKRTRMGLEIRAVSQNRAMAKAMGIRSEWVDAMTFGLGSGIAGMAGVALSQLTNVNPNLGQSYIIDSFMVVVFGGVGNLWGAMVAACRWASSTNSWSPMRGRAGKDFRARSADSVHSDAAARPVPANRPRGGKPVVMPPRQYTLWISARKGFGKRDGFWAALR